MKHLYYYYYYSYIRWNVLESIDILLVVVPSTILSKLILANRIGKYNFIKKMNERTNELIKYTKIVYYNKAVYKLNENITSHMWNM